MTNIFISWSGSLSQDLAEELHRWIPSVLQFSKPYFTPKDIEKGAKWNSEISKKLSETNIGLVILTRDNTTKPWILFEAGALSKDRERSRICSVLFGIDNTDISGPLSTFQTTKFDKVEFKKLMNTINDSGGDQKLTKETFDSVFDMWWPNLQEKISAILSKDSSNDDSELRDDRDILEEVLNLTRSLNQRSRTGSDRVSKKAITHMMELSKGFIQEGIAYSDSDILRKTDELFDIVSYFGRSVGFENDNFESDIANFRRVIADKIAEFDGLRAAEDDIPF